MASCSSFIHRTPFLCRMTNERILCDYIVVSTDKNCFYYLTHLPNMQLIMRILTYIMCARTFMYCVLIFAMEQVTRALMPIINVLAVVVSPIGKKISLGHS